MDKKELFSAIDRARAKLKAMEKTKPIADYYVIARNGYDTYFHDIITPEPYESDQSKRVYFMPRLGDAHKFRDMDEARKVAREVEGTVCIVTTELKPI